LSPPVMPAARLSLPRKLNVTFVPGWPFSIFLPRVVRLSWSEAAAKTVTVPDRFGDEDADGEGSDVADEESSEEEQAVRDGSAADTAPAARRVRRVRCVGTVPCGSRSGSGAVDVHVGRLHACGGLHADLEAELLHGLPGQQ